MRRKISYLTALLAILIVTYFSIIPLPGLVSEAFATARPKSTTTVSLDATITGTYKAVGSDGHIGWVSVSQSGDSVNVDITASGVKNVGDCHFNFNAPLNGKYVEYTGTTNKDCKIRIEFLSDRLELAATNACGDPKAPFENLATCEMGVTLVNGSYKKEKEDPMAKP